MAISGVPRFTLLTVGDDPFVSGSVGAVAGVEFQPLYLLYWTGDTTGHRAAGLHGPPSSALLDNVIRPVLVAWVPIYLCFWRSFPG